MKIGLTFNLGTDYQPTEEDPEDIVAEFDTPVTIEGLKGAIEAAGHEAILIGDGLKLFEFLHRDASTSYSISPKVIMAAAVKRRSPLCLKCSKSRMSDPIPSPWRSLSIKS